MNTAKLIENHLPNSNWATAYAEPGYSEPNKGIIFDNWNYIPSKLQDFLESIGFELEWSDEWSTCSDCGKALRTQPDSYAWQPHYVTLNDCEEICLDCLDPFDHFGQCVNNPDRSWQLPIERLTEQEFKLVNDTPFESGHHGGQDDNPSTILKRLRLDQLKADGPTMDHVFHICEHSQFYIRFNVYSRRADY